MKRNQADLQANKAYHDRVAARYDTIYTGPRWDAWYEISWHGIKPYLPVDLRTPVADLGCGTGKFGLRLAKSGYDTTFLDLSHAMLEVSRCKASRMGLDSRVQFVQADITDLSMLPAGNFGLVVAQGDVLSFASNPSRALHQICGILKADGKLIASVDQTFAAITHYAEKGDLSALKELLTRGTMEWLAKDHKERFPVHTFRPEELGPLLDKTGFELLDVFGKTVLSFKKLESMFQDTEKVREIMALEKKICRIPSAMGLASHLQFVARRK